MTPTARRPQYRTFFGAPPRDLSDGRPADVAFLGVPFDLGTTLRPGARFGPSAVRAASAWSSYYTHDGNAAGGWYDLDLRRWILRGVTMVDWGDVEITPADITHNLDRTTVAVEEVLEAGSLPVLIGGDHAITYPALRAFAERGPIHVVQFDTHQDFVDERQGTRLGHGNVMRRASELPYVSGISQIGLRGLQKYSEPLKAADAYGLRTVSASEVRMRGPEAAANIVPPGASYYLSVDIDVLDIAVAPGTGTPEPGGLSYAELRDAIRAVAARGHVVGLDLVEVSPPYDWAEITSRTAARLLLVALDAVFRDRDPAARQG
ncbi:MAG TPA: arginase family protein [bacterium]|nr:arginase family protein [bacterium]